MNLQLPVLFYYLCGLCLLACSFAAANSDDQGVSSSSSSILDSYHATTTVKSRLAETTIAMVFHNPNEYCSDNHSMTLQLPRNARLSNLIMDLSDGCQLNSTVKVLETAIDEFNDASSQGQAAALVTASWDMTNYNLQISIPPNGTTSVELTYSELLFQKLGQVNFQVPLYPGGGGGGIPINRLQMDIIVEESNTGIFEFNPGTLLLLDGDDDMALVDTTFVVGQAFASAHYETSQIPESATLPTLLQASYKPGPLPESGLFLSDGNCFTHLFNPTTFLSSAGSMARKIVFVIDVSLSMEGQKLDDAKASFVAMIDTLDDRDTLIVQSFSDEGTESIWGPATATSSNKNQAKEIVTRLETIAGTNLHQAFVDGINNVYDAPSEVAPILVILTDGRGNTCIGQKDTARDVLSANDGRKVKIFALGFGDDADMDLLLGIAIQNGGRAVRIYEGFGDAVTQMEQFYLQELGTIMLSDIDVSYNFGGDGDGEGVIVAGLNESTVPQFPVLALGSDIVVRGKLDYFSLSIPANAMLSSTVTAHSAVGAQEWLNEYPIIQNDILMRNSDCRSSFAQARIAELLEYRDAERALGEDIFGGDGSSSSTSTTRSTTSSVFEEQARQIAVDADLVWPGLTALVTVKNTACQQNTHEVCRNSGDGAEGNSSDEINNNDIESGWVDAGTLPAGTVQSSSGRSGGSGTYSYGMMITSLCSCLLATTLLMAASYFWD